MNIMKNIKKSQPNKKLKSPLQNINVFNSFDLFLSYIGYIKGISGLRLLMCSIFFLVLLPLWQYGMREQGNRKKWRDFSSLV